MLLWGGLALATICAHPPLGCSLGHGSTMVVTNNYHQPAVMEYKMSSCIAHRVCYNFRDPYSTIYYISATQKYINGIPSLLSD